MDEPFTNPSAASGDEGEEYFFSYSASLRIAGDGLDLGSVSAALRLQPTHSHNKGEPYKHDMWHYSPPVDKSEPLEKHIDALWRVMKPHKQYLLQLKKSFTVDVFLGYRSNCETAGFEVPHTSLEMFIELQIPFGVSVIVA